MERKVEEFRKKGYFKGNCKEWSLQTMGWEDSRCRWSKGSNNTRRILQGKTTKQLDLKRKWLTALRLKRQNKLNGMTSRRRDTNNRKQLGCRRLKVWRKKWSKRRSQNGNRNCWIVVIAKTNQLSNPYRFNLQQLKWSRMCRSCRRNLRFAWVYPLEWVKNIKIWILSSRV